MCVCAVRIAAMVLIETLWNVKDIVSLFSLPVEDVLIETLWNVKKLAPIKDAPK